MTPPPVAELVRPDAVEATDTDAEAAYANAVEMAGVPVSELRRQGECGHFDSVRARLAWMVLRGLRKA